MAPSLDEFLVRSRFKDLQHFSLDQGLTSASAALTFFRAHPSLETLEAGFHFARPGMGYQDVLDLIPAIPLLPLVRKVELPEGWVAGILSSHASPGVPPIEELHTTFSASGPLFGHPELMSRLPQLRRIQIGYAPRDTAGTLEILARHFPELRWIQMKADYLQIFGHLHDTEWRPWKQYPSFISDWVSVRQDHILSPPLFL